MSSGVFSGTSAVYWSGAPWVKVSCSCWGVGSTSYAVRLYFLPPTTCPFDETTSSALASYRQSFLSEIDRSGYGAGTNWDRKLRLTLMSILFSGTLLRSPVKPGGWVRSPLILWPSGRGERRQVLPSKRSSAVRRR